MQSKPRFATQAIHLARSVDQLREAADQVTRICEWIVYAIRGEDVAASSI